ncbi:chemotaxis protein CheW [Rossellomorea sp. LJF3]|uniref:chemotaxis protein CheW n=1 Tax=Rossellomorea sp. LJF3 TaxID=3126099 RepID=UPI00300C1591
MKDESEEFKVVAFRIGNEEYACQISQIISIERTQTVTALPGMPDYFHGIINLRGSLTPIIDLRTLLNTGSSPLQTDFQRYIVVKIADKPVGLIVDEATDVLDIPLDSIQRDTIVNAANIPYLLGILHLGNRIIILLDVTQLLLIPTNLTEHLSIKKPSGSEEHEIQYSS